MGSLEESSKARARRANLKKVILATVQIAGLLAITAMAPNVIGALGKLGFLPSRRREESIRNARSRLIQQGYLACRNGKVSLTQKGERELRKSGHVARTPSSTQRWDGKWRVLIFDIPNSRKGLRDAVRRSLRGHGFERLQNSVWAYPYNCEDFVTLLKADFRIGKDMQYMIVDSIEEDRRLRSIFELK